MSLRFLLVRAVAAAAALILPRPAEAATLFVGPDADFPSIAAAAAAAAPGDELLIAPGTYDEGEELTDLSDLVVRGASIATTRVRVNCGTTIEISRATVSHLTLEATCDPPRWQEAIEISARDTAFIERTAIRGVGGVVRIRIRGGTAESPVEIEDTAIVSITEPEDAWETFSVSRGAALSIRRSVVLGSGLGRLEGGSLVIWNVVANGALGYAAHLGASSGAPHHLEQVTLIDQSEDGILDRFAVEFDFNSMVGTEFDGALLHSRNEGIYASCRAAWSARYSLASTAADEVVVTTRHPNHDFPFPNCIPMVDPTGTDGNLHAAPMFRDLSYDGNPLNDDLCFAEGAPAIDAGDPDRLDPDGSRADIGAFGGPDALDCNDVVDRDGDGFIVLSGDCDDGDPGAFPHAEEVACDGVDQNCDGVDLEPDEGCGDDDDSADDDDSVDDDDATDDDIDTLPDCGCTSPQPSAALLAPLLLPPLLRRRRYGR